MNKKSFHHEFYGNEQLYKIDHSILKNAMVVVHHDEGELPANSASLLEKILGAVDKSIKSVRLINTARSPLNIDHYWGCTILLFGVPDTAMNNFPTKFYQFEKISGNQVLASDSLLQLEGDTSLKTALWKSLKLLKN